MTTEWHAAHNLATEYVLKWAEKLQAKRDAVGCNIYIFIPRRIFYLNLHRLRPVKSFSLGEVVPPLVGKQSQ